MRKMTEAELNRLYVQGKCPNGNCEETEFWQGARGGMCRNIRCCSCDTKINAIDMEITSSGSPFPHAGEIIEEGHGYVEPVLPVPETWIKRFLVKVKMTKVLG